MTTHILITTDAPCDGCGTPGLAVDLKRRAHEKATVTLICAICGCTRPTPISASLADEIEDTFVRAPRPSVH